MISLAVERLILALRHDSVNSKMGNVQHQTEALEDRSLCVDTVPDCPLGSQIKKQETQRSSACQGGNRGGERQTRSLTPKAEVPTSDFPVKDY